MLLSIFTINYLFAYIFTHTHIQRTLKLALMTATLKTELKCNSNDYSSWGRNVKEYSKNSVCGIF